MLISPDVMRALLFASLLGMALLAGFFLRQRRMSLQGYLRCGLLIALIPLIGPFLVILARPGDARRESPPRLTVLDPNQPGLFQTLKSKIESTLFDLLRQGR